MNRDSWEDDENSSNLLLRVIWEQWKNLGKRWKCIQYSNAEECIACFKYKLMWNVILSNLFHSENALDFLTLERFLFFFSSSRATFVCVRVLHSPRLLFVFTSWNIFMQYCLTCLESRWKMEDWAMIIMKNLVIPTVLHTVAYWRWQFWLRRV